MNKSGEMTMMMVGDVHVNRPEPLSVFQHVAPILQQADITLGNQETPICDQGQPIMGKTEIGSVHMRAVPGMAEALPRAGFTAMGFASNHSMDYGPEGLLQCLQLLDKAGIVHAGGGRNLAEARKPAIIERAGVRVALLAYTSVYLSAGFAASEDKPGIATVKVHTAYQPPDNILYQPGYPAITITMPDPIETDRMLEDVRQAKQHADIVVASFHWGVSFGYGRVIGYQKELGRAAIDAGADIIMGHHPHRLLGMEMYKGKLICYSLGNFVIDGVRAAHFGQETLIVKAYVRDKQIERLTFIAADVNDNFQPQVVDPQKRIEMMETLSEEFGTTFTRDGDEVVISGPKPGTPPPGRGMSILSDSMMPLPYKKKLFQFSEPKR